MVLSALQKVCEKEGKGLERVMVMVAEKDQVRQWSG
jgi:hypothetical protein